MRQATLTEKHAAFVSEYLVDHNATQAAIRAGYAPTHANVTAHDLLRHPNVYQRLRRMAKAKYDKFDLSAVQTLERWVRIAGVSVASLVDPVTGEPRRLNERDPEVAYCLEAYELDEDGRREDVGPESVQIHRFPMGVGHRTCDQFDGVASWRRSARW
jgi:hypothetical protein